jgi:membrane fusion protein, multidrug efflux system
LAYDRQCNRPRAARQYPTPEKFLEARARVRLELILADGTTYPQQGKVYFADRQVDLKTGAMRIAGVFPNPGNVLRPGQYGRVRAAIDVKHGALLVPQQAVFD